MAALKTSEVGKILAQLTENYWSSLLSYMVRDKINLLVSSETNLNSIATGMLHTIQLRIISLPVRYLKIKVQTHVITLTEAMIIEVDAWGKQEMRTEYQRENVRGRYWLVDKSADWRAKLKWILKK